MLLRTFGGLSVSTPRDQLLVTGRRPLALLAILAQGEPVSRDKIIAYLWPDADIDRGRNALNQTLFGLRRALASTDAIVGRSDLQLNRAVIATDRADFAEAVERGDVDAAMALYAGPFLDGFHLSGAPAFEQWMEEQRDLLRRRATGALRAAAESARRGGDRVRGVEYWRRLVDIDPYDERAALELIRDLDASGHRVASLQFARGYEDRLREELDVEPSDEVSAAIRALRAVPPATDALPSPIAPATPPRTEGSTPPAIRPRQRPARAMVVAVAVTMILISIVVARRGASPAHAIEPDFPATAAPLSIAVFPFATQAPPAYAYLRDAVRDLLSRDLDRAGVLRAVDPTRVARVVRDSARVTDAARGAALARELGASRFVLGSVIVADSLRVSATIYDTRSQNEIGHAAVVAATTKPLAAVAHLAEAIMVSQAPRENARVDTAAAGTTTSVDAFKAFLEGEEHFREGRYAVALDDYEKAVRIDSTFALAYYRLAVVADWAGQMNLVLDAARRASRLSGRLSNHERMLIEAHLAWREARIDDGERLYRAIVRAYPDDEESWYQLGELLFHGNMLRGRSFVESAEAFRRVLELDPRDQTAITHLARIAARERTLPLLDSLIARGKSVLPSTDSRELRALRASVSGNVAEQRAMIDEYVRSDPAAIETVVWRVAVFARGIAFSEQLANAVRSSSAPQSAKFAAYSALVWLDLARGRHAAVTDDLRWIKEHGGEEGAGADLNIRSYIALLPWLPVDPPAVDALRASLDSVARIVSTRPLPEPTQSQYSLCLSALIAARAGRSAVAERLVTRFANVRSGEVATTMFATCRSSVRAREALARGDSADALRELTASYRRHPVATLHDPIDHFLMAELLQRSGQRDDAAQWIASIADRGLEDLPLLGHLQRLR